MDFSIFAHRFFMKNLWKFISQMGNPLGVYETNYKVKFVISSVILLYIISGIAILPQLLNIQKNVLDNRSLLLDIFPASVAAHFDEKLSLHNCFRTTCKFFSANMRYCLAEIKANNVFFRKNLQSENYLHFIVIFKFLLWTLFSGISWCLWSELGHDCKQMIWCRVQSGDVKVQND